MVFVKPVTVLLFLILGINERSLKAAEAKALSPAVITKSPVNIVAPVGKTVAFECKASGSPTPVFQWFKNAKTVQGTQFSISSLNGSLTIKAVKATDAGTYKCQVSNGFGIVPSKTATLVVKAATVIKGTHLTKEIEAGISVTYKCTVTSDASSNVKVDWLFQGLPIDYTTQNYEKNINNSLTIINPTPLNSGTYTCRAKTLYDEVSRLLTVMVREQVTTELVTEVASTEAATELATSEAATEVATSEAATELASTESATELASTESATELASTETVTELASTEDATELASTESATELASTETATELASTESATELASTDSATELASTEDATEFSTTESASQPTTSESTSIIRSLVSRLSSWILSFF